MNQRENRVNVFQPSPLSQVQTTALIAAEVQKKFDDAYQKYGKPVDDFMEKLDNVTSGNGWKTDAQVASDHAAQDAQNKAAFGPNFELKIGIADP
jgi:hypothetical protein